MTMPPFSPPLRRSRSGLLVGLIAATCCVADAAAQTQPPPGFKALFNGKDLAGWRGGDTFDHRKWLAMPEAERTAKNADWTADMRKHWRAEKGEVGHDGSGKYSNTEMEYWGVEMLLS